jgi:methylated-DNA-[protein]-cysteine S-methyltransferase
VDRLRAELAAYFGGRLRRFGVPLDLAGTAFQQRVWSRLREIPFGDTVSYARIAREVGRRDAVRAVGHANGRNPVAIVVPCHRVVGTDGSLCGYGGGLWRKRWLLEHERAALRPSRSEAQIREPSRRVSRATRRRAGDRRRRGCRSAAAGTSPAGRAP